MASTVIFVCLLLTLSSLLILPSFSETITLDLSPILKQHTSKDSIDVISDLAKSTLHRAYHLKQHHKHHHHHHHHYSHASDDNAAPFAPIFARGSPGRYSLPLSLGTPPQTIPTIFDTGSSLVWVPCTSHYSCSNCSRSLSEITVFKPKRSTSKEIVNCKNPKCKWLDQPFVKSSCPSCKRCKTPCSYIQAYGLGRTSGSTITDKLDLNGGKVIDDFFVGCSSSSSFMPEGITGFGRNPMSLPNQLNLDKFSYCLVSHKLDDTSKSSRLILGDSKIEGLKYTPLVKNPPMLPFNQYYYVHLEAISVGKRFVKNPSEVHGPDSNGNGGCIIDSGTTFTTLPSSLFTPLTNEFIAQMLPNKRDLAEFAPTNIGNVLCVNVSGEPNLTFPEVALHYKGGVKMDMPAANYLVASGDRLCLPFVNSTLSLGTSGSGPAVIVGNYQQQDFHIEYDLKNERLGLKKRTCG